MMAQASQIMEQLTTAMNKQRHAQRRTEDLEAQLAAAKKAEGEYGQRAMQLAHALSASLSSTHAVSTATTSGPPMVTLSPSALVSESNPTGDALDPGNAISLNSNHEITNDPRIKDGDGASRAEGVQRRKCKTVPNVNRAHAKPENRTIINHSFASVVNLDGVWTEISCHVCGSNAGKSGAFFKGVNGLLHHMQLSHVAMTGQAVLEVCNKRVVSVGDAANMRAGKEPVDVPIKPIALLVGESKGKVLILGERRHSSAATKDHATVNSGAATATGHEPLDDFSGGAGKRRHSNLMEHVGMTSQHHALQQNGAKCGRTATSSPFGAFGAVNYTGVDEERQ